MAKIYKCFMKQAIYFTIKADSEEDVQEWLATHSIEDVEECTSGCTQDFEDDIMLIDVTKTEADINISISDRFPETCVITDIYWNVDDESILEGLPKEVTVPLSSLIEEGYVSDDIEDASAEIESVVYGALDYLSDKYEWLVLDCSVELVNENKA